MIKKFYTNLSKLFRTIFINGLLTILPITITFGILRLFHSIVHSWLHPLEKLKPEFFKLIPGSEILLALIFIFAVGAILKFFLLQPLVLYFENILNKIPLLRPIYFGIKQIVHAFTASDTMSFQQVVLVEFPRQGIYSVGFLTSTLHPELAPDNRRNFYSIYIPTTPNPTTGYYICVPEGTFIKVDLTRQEAMALIISGGIIQPDRFTKNIEQTKG